MGDIRKLLGESAGSRVQQFQQIAGTLATEAEKRAAEMSLLEPEPLPKYDGPEATADSVKERTVTLYFRKLEDAEQFKRHFHVNAYVKLNCFELDKLSALLTALDNGVILYDPATNTVSPTGKGLSTRKFAVGSGE